MPKKIDLMELFGKGVKQDERQFHKQMVNIHEFYLSGEIESPDEYIQWFDTIRHAGETDVIKIYINSPGGDISTAIQFMRVLKETAANVVVSIEGQCASAATMIMLCADSYEISDHSLFMFHTYSGGIIGKGSEMNSQIQHQQKWSKRLLNEIYKDFLTPDEINRILDGVDIWMDPEEVTNRLKARQAKLEAEEEQEAEIPEKETKKRIHKKKVSE